MIIKLIWMKENRVRMDGIIVFLLREGSTVIVQGEAEQVIYIRTINNR